MTLSVPKVFDSFLYNGEPIVWFRLQLYAPVVDHFYITESRYTFSGKRKDVLYIDMYRNLFQPYIDIGKITFLVIEEYSPEFLSYENWIERYQTFPTEWMIQKEAWYRENYQREWVLSVIAKETNYILLVTDSDEIINPYYITELKETMYNELTTPLHVSMDMFNYNFKWLKNVYWKKGFIVNDRFIHSDIFQSMYNGLLSIIRTFSEKETTRFIENGGWHCSYFLSLVDIHRKIISFAHTELCKEKYIDIGYIHKCIKEGKELFKRDQKDTNKLTIDTLFQTPTSLELPDGWESLQKTLEQLQNIE